MSARWCIEALHVEAWHSAVCLLLPGRPLCVCTDAAVGGEQVLLPIQLQVVWTMAGTCTADPC